MIRNLIFDVGGVLIDYLPEKYLKSFGWDEETNRRVAAATYLSPVWQDRDAGLAPEDELVKRMVERDPDMESQIRQFMAHSEETCHERAGSEAWVKGLKDHGYRLYILSNYSEYMWELQEPTYRFFPYFNGAIISYRYQTRKPFPDIYERLLSTYRLKPEECIFLDDTAENLRAAEAFGIRTVQVTTQEQAKEDLKKLGVE